MLNSQNTSVDIRYQILNKTTKALVLFRIFKTQARVMTFGHFSTRWFDMSVDTPPSHTPGENIPRWTPVENLPKKTLPGGPRWIFTCLFSPRWNPFWDNRESLTPVNSGQIWPIPVKIMYKAITPARIHFCQPRPNYTLYTGKKFSPAARFSLSFLFFLLLTGTDTLFIYTIPHIS